MKSTVNEFSLRKMKPEDLTGIFSHVTEDFAPGEYAPYDILLSHLKSGAQEGFVFCLENCDTAYAICAVDPDHGYVMISLMAVFPEFRGKGIGTEFLRALQKIFSSENGIIVEVERTIDAENVTDLHEREQRVHFYEKLGYRKIAGIEYRIWDVPMDLMALPIRESYEEICSGIGGIMYDLYVRMMGKKLMKKMELRTGADG